jgi:hypothetical protein
MIVSLERLPAKLRNLQPNLSGLGVQIPLAVAGSGIAISLAALVALALHNRSGKAFKVSATVPRTIRSRAEVVLDLIVINRDDIGKRTRCILRHGDSCLSCPGCV